MATVAEFIVIAKENNVSSIAVSNYRTAKSNGLKHIRSGKIERKASKEGAGVEVRAYGFDELGNVVALCKDGIIRQFIG